MWKTDTELQTHGKSFVEIEFHFQNVINNVNTSLVRHIWNLCAERQTQIVSMQNDLKIYWKSNGIVKLFFYFTSTCLNGSWRSFPKIFCMAESRSVSFCTFRFFSDFIPNETFKAKRKNCIVNVFYVAKWDEKLSYSFWRTILMFCCTCNEKISHKTWMVIIEQRFVELFTFFLTKAFQIFETWNWLWIY